MLDEGPGALELGWEFGTPLQLAAASGCEGAVALLLAAGADANVRNPFPLPLCPGGISRRTGVPEYDRYSIREFRYETALQVACVTGSEDLVYTMLISDRNPAEQPCRQHPKMASRRLCNSYSMLALIPDFRREWGGAR